MPQAKEEAKNPRSNYSNPRTGEHTNIERLSQIAEAENQGNQLLPTSQQPYTTDIERGDKQRKKD